MIVSGLYKKAGIEPPLHELMADELTIAVMQRDNLSPETVWSYLDAARVRLRDREQREQESLYPPLRQCA